MWYIKSFYELNEGLEQFKFKREQIEDDEDIHRFGLFKITAFLKNEKIGSITYNISNLTNRGGINSIFTYFEDEEEDINFIFSNELNNEYRYFGDIQSLYINENYKKIGIATELTKQCLDHMKKLKIKNVVLFAHPYIEKDDINTSKKALIRPKKLELFYKKFGFETLYKTKGGYLMYKDM